MAINDIRQPPLSGDENGQATPDTPAGRRPRRRRGYHATGVDLSQSPAQAAKAPPAGDPAITAGQPDGENTPPAPPAGAPGKGTA